MSFREWLVSFNLHDEVFIVDSFPRYMVRYSGVIDFEGSVAVISKSVGEGSGISLYTLDRYPGGVSSWSKKFDVCDDIGWVYSYLGGGLLYARTTVTKFKLLYSIVTKFKHGVYACRQKDFKSFQLSPRVEVLKYTETLVSIKGFQPLTYDVLKKNESLYFQHMKLQNC